MPTIIDTADRNKLSFTPDEAHYVYNALDCCLTTEIFEAIQPKLDEDTAYVYQFERDLQAPLMEMSGRGVLIDKAIRNKMVIELQSRAAKYDAIIQRFAHAIWDKPLNAASPAQLKSIFYETMGIKPIRVQTQGKWEISTNREALEKIQLYFHARPLATTLLALRDVTKKIQTLTTGLDPDGRFRTSFNIAATVTGRLSSSENCFGTGGNLQNITDDLRSCFIPDPGKKIGYFDLAQAESRAVGLLAYLVTGRSTYLEACEAGDLHTTVAKLCWPTLRWPGDLKGDRALAEERFYRMFSRRDLSKRGGHGCLTEDHEVLTPEGWVSITEKPSVIMTWANNESKFDSVSHWEDKLYTGTLYTFDSLSVSAEVTHDHRVVHYRDPGNPNSKPTVSPAEAKLTGGIPLGWGYIGGKISSHARLIAAFQCDGHQKSKNRMEFHFHKQRKKDRLKQLASAAGFIWRETEDKIFLEGSLPKLPGAYMLQWTTGCIKAYIDELKHWDGHISDTAVTLFSTNKTTIDWWQTLGRLTGIGGNIQKPKISGFGSVVCRLQQNNRKFSTLSTMKKTAKKVEGVRVLCPAVPSSFFYIRRKGRISVTGNTNYYGQAATIARNLQIDLTVARDFQTAYFKAFPEIEMWHKWVEQQLIQHGALLTPMRRYRQFFGRPTDGSTLRAAIAHSPQSMIADMVDRAILNIWRDLPEVELLMQVHDAIVVQYNAEDEARLVPIIQTYMQQEMTFDDFEVLCPFTNKVIRAPGRKFFIGSDAQVGWNWAKAVSPEYAAKKKIAENPWGLENYRGGDFRKGPSTKTANRSLKSLLDIRLA